MLLSGSRIVEQYMPGFSMDTSMTVRLVCIISLPVMSKMYMLAILLPDLLSIQSVLSAGLGYMLISDLFPEMLIAEVLPSFKYRTRVRVYTVALSLIKDEPTPNILPSD